MDIWLVIALRGDRHLVHLHDLSCGGLAVRFVHSTTPAPYASYLVDGGIRRDWAIDGIFAARVLLALAIGDLQR